jgi:hypothetical protein
MNHDSKFAFGDRVIIDNDKSLVAVVTAFSFRLHGYAQIEVAWVHNGDTKSAWIEAWRLSGT